MRRGALPLLVLVLAACTAASGAGEHLDVTRRPFASADAVLFDFEIDGALVSDTNDEATLRAQVEAQLMFTVGQLNGDSSVGRFERLEVSDIAAESFASPPPAAPEATGLDGGDAGADGAGAGDAGPTDAGASDAGATEAGASPPPVVRYAVTYHAKLPVAWGARWQPTGYTFTLPASTTGADQASFVAKYGATCFDPEGGVATPGTMFVHYRPNQPGCQLAASDVVRPSATVTRSGDNTLGKYPEYQRVWADAALEVVVMFSRAESAPGPSDDGASAFNRFVVDARDYLQQLQPDGARRTAQIEVASAGSSAPVQARLGALLPDGRRVGVAARLVAYELASEGADFDAWYDAVTPAADLVVYNGHAGLGEAVATLMSKGTFRPGQYLIWYANACDTLAYVDRTLVERRLPLNPDDPSGTKYLDTVTNVLGAYFSSMPATSMTFIEALVEARDSTPKRYEEIFADVDPSQITVVTGEEDNQLGPIPPAPPLPPAAEGAPADPKVAPTSSARPGESQPLVASPPPAGHGCEAAPGGAGARSGLALVALAFAAIGARRLRIGAGLRAHPPGPRGPSAARALPRVTTSRATRADQRWRSSRRGSRRATRRSRATAR